MKHPIHTWTIEAFQAKERLDVFLNEQLPDLSRAQIQKLIKNGTILLNQQTTSVHHFLKEGDVVEEYNAPMAEKTSTDAVHYSTGPIEKLAPLTIMKETADWLVINKPAGLLVHPDGVQEHGTLIDLLLEHDPKIASVGGSPERPGIVHRLDKEVSGLMVIAKTHAAYESLQRQFAERHVKKTYLALVHGEMPQEEGDIKFRIARSSTKARMAARPEKEEEGQAAWTHYRVKERFVGAALVEIEILSGRTHQIRAHFLALKHPVIGDTLYSLKKTDRNLVSPRLMLQSIGLEFTDPATGARQSFHLDPDPTFDLVIKEISSSS